MNDDSSWELVLNCNRICLSNIHMYMQYLPAPNSSGVLHSRKTIQLNKLTGGSLILLYKFFSPSKAGW